MKERKGLGFRKTADAIASFVKALGAEAPRRALLCTFDFHPDRFETVLLPELSRRGRWFRTLVLADASAIQKNGALASRGEAPTYELAPVRLDGPGVFHPKLLLLQAGRRVLVGVGSANLTPGGLGGNLELMLFEDNRSADGRALAGSAVAFLEALGREPRIALTASAHRFIARLIASLPRARGGPLLHSLYEPLLDQIRRTKPPGVRRAIVVSPWHSSSASPHGIEPAVLTAVTRALGARPVVHTEGVRDGALHRGPDLGKGTSVRVLDARAVADDGGESREVQDDASSVAAVRRPATLHAKAYVAVARRGGVLWFGSANCTIPALQARASHTGNVELLVRVELDARALVRLEADLDEMFVTSDGILGPTTKRRIPRARGIVLAATSSGWTTSPVLTLDLASKGRTTRRLTIARTARGPGAVTLTVPAGRSALRLDAAITSRLLGAKEAPPVLWERLAEGAVPFPVSIATAPEAGGAEATLEDLLDELAGRIPPAIEASRRRRRPGEGSEDGAGDDAPDDEDDRETELLTKTKHQGELDRIAMRVELLRRRLARASRPSAELCAHYARVLDGLPLPSHQRRILIEHLDSRGAR